MSSENSFQGLIFPMNEKPRQKMLEHLGILGSRAEEPFDTVAHRVRTALNVPIALISFVDGSRLWFKSRIGLDLEEMPRHNSPCSQAILLTDVMVVPDLCKDRRFLHGALVTGPPYMRFYAGAPVIVPDGLIMGTVCVFDITPRRVFLANERRHLLEAAEDVSQLILKKAGLPIRA